MVPVLATAIYLFARVLISAMLITAILSWFVNDYYSPLGRVYGILSRFIEPFVLPCRKLLSRFNTGMIDFSLFLAVILVQMIANLLVRILYTFF